MSRNNQIVFVMNNTEDSSDSSSDVMDENLSEDFHQQDLVSNITNSEEKILRPERSKMTESDVIGKKSCTGEKQAANENDKNEALDDMDTLFNKNNMNIIANYELSTSILTDTAENDEYYEQNQTRVPLFDSSREEEHHEESLLNNSENKFLKEAQFCFQAPQNAPGQNEIDFHHEAEFQVDNELDFSWSDPHEDDTVHNESACSDYDAEMVDFMEFDDDDYTLTDVQEACSTTEGSKATETEMGLAANEVKSSSNLSCTIQSENGDLSNESVQITQPMKESLNTALKIKHQSENNFGQNLNRVELGEVSSDVENDLTTMPLKEYSESDTLNDVASSYIRPETESDCNIWRNLAYNKDLSSDCHREDVSQLNTPLTSNYDKGSGKKFNVFSHEVERNIFTEPEKMNSFGNIAKRTDFKAVTSNAKNDLNTTPLMENVENDAFTDVRSRHMSSENKSLTECIIWQNLTSHKDFNSDRGREINQSNTLPTSNSDKKPGKESNNFSHEVEKNIFTEPEEYFHSEDSAYKITQLKNDFSRCFAAAKKYLEEKSSGGMADVKNDGESSDINFISDSSTQNARENDKTKENGIKGNLEEENYSTNIVCNYVADNESDSVRQVGEELFLLNTGIENKRNHVVEHFQQTDTNGMLKEGNTMPKEIFNMEPSNEILCEELDASSEIFPDMPSQIKAKLSEVIDKSLSAKDNEQSRFTNVDGKEDNSTQRTPTGTYKACSTNQQNPLQDVEQAESLADSLRLQEGSKANNFPDRSSKFERMNLSDVNSETVNDLTTMTSIENRERNTFNDVKSNHKSSESENLIECNKGFDANLSDCSIIVNKEKDDELTGGNSLSSESEVSIDVCFVSNISLEGNTSHESRIISPGISEVIVSENKNIIEVSPHNERFDISKMNDMQSLVCDESKGNMFTCDTPSNLILNTEKCHNLWLDSQTVNNNNSPSDKTSVENNGTENEHAVQLVASSSNTSLNTVNCINFNTADHAVSEKNPMEIHGAESELHGDSVAGPSQLREEPTNESLSSAHRQISEGFDLLPAQDVATLISEFLENTKNIEFSIRDIVRYVTKSSNTITFLGALHSIRMFMNEAAKIGIVTARGETFTVVGSTQNKGSTRKSSSLNAHSTSVQIPQPKSLQSSREKPAGVQGRKSTKREHGVGDGAKGMNLRSTTSSKRSKKEAGDFSQSPVERTLFHHKSGAKEPTLIQGDSSLTSGLTLSENENDDEMEISEK